MLIERVLQDLYRLEIPLPGSPLKSTNSYVIRSPERNLVIDTGMNREECLSAMVKGLRELSVDLEKTDFFITHMHADHSGLVSALASKGSKIFTSLPDSVMICPVVDTVSGWYKKMTDFALLNGFPEEVLQDALRLHPGFRYSATGPLEFNIVGDKDVIIAGDYTFTCVETPGHTWGHLCLYDKDKKLLVAGDHILNDITPNISVWSDEKNSLKEYLDSLDKIRALEVSLVLPGHRNLIEDCRGRIDELKEHHRQRGGEILSVLQGGPLDAYRVASAMSWDLTYNSWEQFPSPQKWFATGEAVAHLIYLEGEGRVLRKFANGRILFSNRDR